MKKILILFVLMFSAVAVNAQLAQSTDAQTANVHATQMKKLLGLTDTQTSQVEQVLLAKITKVHEIQADAAMNADQKTAAIAQADADAETSLSTILTADQMTRYKAEKKTRQDRAAAGATQQ